MTVARADVGRQARKILGRDTAPVELVFSGFTLGVGLCFLSPFWDTFPTTPAYALLGRIMPETGWGWVATLTAFLRIYGAVWGCRTCRLAAAMIGCFIWSVMTIGVWTVSPHSAAVFIFGWYSVVCLYLVVRLKWGAGAGES
jgi:hypothetical protein